MRSDGLFTHRGFAALLTTHAVSAVGAWMQSLAIASIVADLGGSAVWVAASSTLPFFFQGLAAPMSGHLVDRYGHLRVLRWAVVGQCSVSLALLLAVVTGHGSPLVLVTGAGLEGLFLSAAIPARFSLIPDLVGKERAVTATSLFNMADGVGVTVGPVLGALLLIHGVPEWTFAINALSLSAVVVATFVVARRRVVGYARQQHEEEMPVSAFLRRSWHLMGGECRAALVLKMLLVVFIAPFIALVPAMAQLTYRGTGAFTGLFYMSMGIGMIVGGYVLTRLNRRHELSSIVKVLAWILPLAVAGYAVAPTIWSSAALLFFAMALYMAMLTSLQSVLQINAPDDIRGRVISLSVSLYCLGYPLGSFTTAWIADQVGVRIALCAGAVLFALTRVVHRRRCVVRPDRLNTIR